jgi:hypothetical protein
VELNQESITGRSSSVTGEQSIGRAHGGRVLGAVPNVRGFFYQDQVAVNTRDTQGIFEGDRTQLERSLGRLGNLMIIPNSGAQRPSRVQLRQ